MNPNPMLVRGACAALCSIIFLAGLQPAQAAGFAVKTTVEDFVTTKWTLDCPDGRKIDLTKVDLSEEGQAQFMECLGEIESENGIEIRSRTSVRDFVTQEDRIDSETELDEEQALKLCQLIDNHRQPVVAFANGRARVQTIVVDGVVESHWIDLGDGRVLDLTDPGLDPVALAIFEALIVQIENESGVHIAGESSNEDGDRVRSVSYLTAQQIQQILVAADGLGLAIALDLFEFDAELGIKISADGQSERVLLQGTATARIGDPQPLPGGGTEVPIEIVELELQGASPLAGAIRFGLEDGIPWEGVMIDPRNRGRFEMQLPGLPSVDLLDQDIQGVRAEPYNIGGKVKVPLRRNPKLKLSGERDFFPADGDPEFDDPIFELKPKRLVPDLPGRVPMFPF